MKVLKINNDKFTLVNLDREELTSLLEIITTAYLPNRRIWYKVKQQIEDYLKDK